MLQITLLLGADSLLAARSFPPALHEIPSGKKQGGCIPGNALDNTYLFMYSLERGRFIVTTIKAKEARAKLFKLLDLAAQSHEPIQITGKRANAILISEEDWRSIQETLYLLSIPAMRESIRRGLKTPVEKCSEKPGW
jgi:antitoxin YefM